MGKKAKKKVKGGKGAPKGEHVDPREQKKLERQRKRELKKERQRARHNKSEFAEFDRELRQFNLVIRDVRPDGNCLFRAVCDQLHGSERDHWDLRQRVCDFMEEQRESFEPFIEDDEGFDQYLRRMRRDAEWGGHLELQAMSLMLGRNIAVHQLAQPSWELQNHGPGAPTIRLSYHEQQHYASVRHIRESAVRSKGAAGASVGAGPDTGSPSSASNSAAAAAASSSGAPTAAGATPQLSDEVLREIMLTTGCPDVALIRRLWNESAGSIEDVKIAVHVHPWEEDTSCSSSSALASAAAMDRVVGDAHAATQSATDADAPAGRTESTGDSGTTTTTTARGAGGGRGHASDDRTVAAAAAAASSSGPQQPSTAAAEGPASSSSTSTSTRPAAGTGCGGFGGKRKGEPKRNAPCPCGSGKKYRKCCHKTRVAAAQGRVNPERERARQARLAGAASGPDAQTNQGIESDDDAALAADIAGRVSTSLLI